MPAVADPHTSSSPSLETQLLARGVSPSLAKMIQRGQLARILMTQADADIFAACLYLLLQVYAPAVRDLVGPNANGAAVLVLAQLIANDDFALNLAKIYSSHEAPQPAVAASADAPTSATTPPAGSDAVEGSLGDGESEIRQASPARLAADDSKEGRR